MSESSATFSRYLAPLDGIRAIAVGMVLLHHVSYGYLPGGFIGVDVFFVLSGFLITGLLLREYTETGRIRLDLFYQRRLYRILPPVVVLLLLVSALYPWINSFEPWDENFWVSLGAVLFFLANLVPGGLGPLGPTWSLAIEEQFYLVWPVALIFLLSRVRRHVAILLVLALFLGLGIVLRDWLWRLGLNLDFIYHFTPTRLDGLLLGAMAALYTDAVPVRRMTRTLCDYRAPEIILLGLVALLPVLNRNMPFLYRGGFALFALLFALLLLCVVGEDRKRWYLALLVSTPMVWLGKRSYGIYLYHLPIFFLLEHLRVPHSKANLILISVLRLGVTLGFAAASYRWVETPLLRRKALLHVRPQ